MDQHTTPDEATEAADEADARREHTADRTATPDEAAVADESLENLDSATREAVAAHEKEMMEIGAAAKGEGAIE